MDEHMITFEKLQQFKEMITEPIVYLCLFQKLLQNDINRFK